MEKILLIRYDEIHLKGQNRPFFERKLVEGIKRALSDRRMTVKYDQGRIFVYGINEETLDDVLVRLKRVFGIHSISVALSVEKTWDAIKDAAFELMDSTIKDVPMSFKVFSRRSDKTFCMNSDEINRELGHELLEKYPNLHVDIRTPELKVCVEVRNQAFVYMNELEGAGGMPSGTSGRAALLISGGIDSPVAGYMLARRGITLSAVHFYSYPYTSERARDKVVDLAKKLSLYTGEIRLHLVPFTKIQMEIYDKCPSKETTVLMRRLMMKIAERIAKSDGAVALITGEALGQVASQTLESLCVTDDAVQMPVFRPLIGFDKDDIVQIAKRIDTFETSILPYEDCCTVFVPQHPVTKPEVKKLRESEMMVDFEPMIVDAIAQTELLQINEINNIQA